MVKGIIKTIVGESVNVEFGETDTPRDVLKEVSRENFELVVPFFENRQKAEEFRNTGVLDVQNSIFSFIDGSEKTLRLDFDIPIIEQLIDIKIDEKSVLTFLVSINAVVGAI